MSSSKKLTCKETLRKVFVRVYRREITSVMLVFSTQLCKLLPLYSNLLFGSNPKQKPRRGGGLRQTNTCRKVPYRSIFLDDDILQYKFASHLTPCQ